MLRPTLRQSIVLASSLALSLSGCPSPSADAPGGANGRGTAQAALALPIADSVALRLATEAAAQFDVAGSASSGPRSCDPALPAERSTRCVLLLTVRSDAPSFSPDAVPGRYAVLASVRNTGDLPELRTGIPGGVTAYLLVEEGTGGRSRAWYFSVDHGNSGRAVVIRETFYRVCEHQHELGPKPTAAWRRCADGPPTASTRPTAAAEGNDRPIWTPCSGGCCVDG